MKLASLGPRRKEMSVPVFPSTACGQRDRAAEVLMHHDHADLELPELRNMLATESVVKFWNSSR